MPLSKLVFKPGINRDQTNYASEGGWYECDKVRFRSGFPEKIGGWVKYTASRFVGICRSLFNWVTSDGNNLLSVATNKKVYVEVGNNLYDITPIRATFIIPASQSATGQVGSVVIPNVSFAPSGVEGTSGLGSVTVTIV